MTIQITHRIRATHEHSKAYIDNSLETFIKTYVKKWKKSTKSKDKIISVDFDKQDIRSCPSITFFNERHCVPHQRHFATNKEMLAFVAGWNQAHSDYV